MSCTICSRNFTTLTDVVAVVVVAVFGILAIVLLLNVVLVKVVEEEGIAHRKHYIIISKSFETEATQFMPSVSF